MDVEVQSNEQMTYTVSLKLNLTGFKFDDPDDAVLLRDAADWLEEHHNPPLVSMSLEDDEDHEGNLCRVLIMTVYINDLLRASKDAPTVALEDDCPYCRVVREREAAMYLGISMMSYYELLAKGTFICFERDGVYGVRLKDLQDFKKKQVIDLR